MLIQSTMTTQPGAKWDIVNAQELSRMIQNDKQKMLLIDSRSFLEYNTCNILRAVNISCSKLVKRRLQQDKVTIKELLSQSCPVITDYEVIVYDQCTETPDDLTVDNFLIVLIKKLKAVFQTVRLLKGGFLGFHAAYPAMCESKSISSYKCAALTSMSQPCLPVSNLGPTKVLPFLYLGSQHDAFSQETSKANGITYILNVSTTCPKPQFIQEGRFLRIPVNDNYNDKLLPHFSDAFQFLDKVREANGCVLVHCLAGISRSPTLAIAYLMRYLKMSSDEAYRYVKDKRPTISPNFNFLGQLLEFEKLLKRETLENQERSRRSTVSTSMPSIENLKQHFSLNTEQKVVHSPTTAMARLNFSQALQAKEACREAAKETTEEIRVLQVNNFPTTSLDKLYLIPCSTREDNSTVKSRSASKRPLSCSVVETTNISPVEESQSNTNLGSTSENVKVNVALRSPEMKAKRPLVRPNSIAFSSYPIFDFGSDDQQQSPTSEAEKEYRSFTNSPCEQKGSIADDDHNNRNTKMMRTKSFDTGRKSRSLDDILSSSTVEAPSGDGRGSDKVNHQTQRRTLETLSKALDLDTLQGRCSGHPEIQQSSSSISSGGSHTSLHGSLELIPVS